MNVHNHSLWPPPGAADVNRPLMASGCGVWPPLPTRAPRIAAAIHSPRGGYAAVIPPMDKG